jgi:hypothetical protein
MSPRSKNSKWYAMLSCSVFNNITIVLKEGQQDEGEEMMEPPPTAPQFVVDASAVQIDYNAMKVCKRWTTTCRSR